MELEDALEEHGMEMVSAIVVLASCFVNALAAQPQIDNAKLVGDLIKALETPATSSSPTFAAIAAEELRKRLQAALHQALNRPGSTAPPATTA